MSGQYVDFIPPNGGSLIVYHSLLQVLVIKKSGFPYCLTLLMYRLSHKPLPASKIGWNYQEPTQLLHVSIAEEKFPKAAGQLRMQVVLIKFVFVKATINDIDGTVPKADGAQLPSIGAAAV